MDRILTIVVLWVVVTGGITYALAWMNHKGVLRHRG